MDQQSSSSSPLSKPHSFQNLRTSSLPVLIRHRAFKSGIHSNDDSHEEGVFKSGGLCGQNKHQRFLFNRKHTKESYQISLLKKPLQGSVSRCVFQERKAVRGDCQTGFCAENPSELGVQRKGTLGSVLVYSEVLKTTLQCHGSCAVRTYSSSNSLQTSTFWSHNPCVSNTAYRIRGSSH